MAGKVTTQAVTSGDPRDNGATVVYGGNIDNSNTVTNAPGFEHIGFRSGISGTSPKESTGTKWTSGVQAANSSGTFAYVMEAGKFIGKRLSTEIGGVSNDVLQSGGGTQGPRSSIHWTDSAVQLGEWATTSIDYFTGTITKGNNDGNSYTFIDPATGSATTGDSAATPTRAIPGKLVVTDSGLAHSGDLAVPLQTTYQPKTG